MCFFSVLFLLFSIICYRKVSSQTYCTYIHEHVSVFLSSADFVSKLSFSLKFFLGIPSECQTVLSGLIWAQTVRKGLNPGPEVMKLFMLNSTEHEISTARKKLKYRQIKKLLVLSLSDV